MDSRAGTHSTRTTRSIEVSLSPGFPGGGPHTHTKHFFFLFFPLVLVHQFIRGSIGAVPCDCKFFSTFCLFLLFEKIYTKTAAVI